ncbi:PAOX (predicted) [Pycnogonum litorale]
MDEGITRILFPEKTKESSTEVQQQKNSGARIVIIGAGVAGLTCASMLNKDGFTDVTIIEAKDRVGGRVHTTTYGDNIIEMGAQFIHQSSVNPAYELMDKHGLIGKAARGKDDFYSFPHFCIEPDHQKTVRNVADVLLEAYENCDRFWSDFRNNNIEKDDLNRSIGDYIWSEFQNEIANGGNKDLELLQTMVCDVILRHIGDTEGVNAFDSSLVLSGVPYDCSDDFLHVEPKRGLLELLKILLKDIPEDRIRTNEPVQRIEFKSDESSVEILTESGNSHVADFVVVTLPLGVLKETHGQLFFPELPKLKRMAIERLSSGRYFKAFLEFQDPFWTHPSTVHGSDADQFDVVPLWSDGKNYQGRNLEDGYTNGSYDVSSCWFRHIFSFNVHVTCPNILIACLFGSGAEYAEQLSDSELIEGFHRTLTICSPANIDIPKPKLFAKSSWFNDPYCRGAYSSLSSKCTEPIMEGEEVITTETLSRPIYDHQQIPRLMFAGEATSTKAIGTIQGAMLSGIREYQRIKSSLI